jgi:hypothetical protein
MKTSHTVLLTAVIAFPLGVLARDPSLKNHPHLEAARHSLDEATNNIDASQKANEHVWKTEGGHAAAAKEHIGQARHELDLAADWVNAHEK